MRTVMILIVLSSVGSLLSQGQSIPTNEAPPPARTYHLLREDDDWSFLADSQQSGRTFGTPSNTFLCDQGGMAGSCPWAAKLARFGNRLETTTGADSRS